MPSLLENLTYEEGFINYQLFCTFVVSKTIYTIFYYAIEYCYF
ncbi:hypothetical protein CAPGI0001_0153 [Capnocytophaga gingivalis ATCC 33624]|nr:hypothetical protein CAPGI0001_0153 [Capnocytophaga gingivalis ATCC 33624]